MWRLFKKRPKMGDQVPQTTQFERRALELGSGTGPGYAAFDEMQRDAMVQTALTIKRQGVLAAEATVEPPDDSSESARRTAFVRECFERMEGSPAQVMHNATDAFAKGWSVQELVWRPEGGRWWLAAVRPKDPALFGLEVDRYGVVRGLRLRMPGEAETDLPRAKFALYRHRPTYARQPGTSDLEAAYPHWRAKCGLMEAWRLHLDRFASPTVLGKFERGLPSHEQEALLAALQQLARNTAILYPNEIEIDTLGGGRDANGGFLEAIEFHNREIARAILGQTLTTDEGRRVGSLALGKVHLQVLLLQLEALRRQLADEVMTEQVIRPLVEANFGPGPIPRYRFQPVSLEAFASGRL